MRFGPKNREQIRIKTWFALLPVTIDGHTRWLERVTVRQYRMIGFLIKPYWRNHEFIDN